MTKNRVKQSLKSNSKIENQPKVSDYCYYGTLTETLSALISPLVSALYFPATESKSKDTNLRNGYTNNKYNLNRSRSCNRKEHRKKSNAKPKIVKIDLCKIEKNLSLSTKKITKLKQILERIRPENGGGISLENRMSKMTTKVNRVGKGSCTNSSCNVTKELKDSICSETLSDITSNTCRDPDYVCEKCTMYKELLKGRKCKEVVVQKLTTGFQQPPGFSTQKPPVNVGKCNVCGKDSSSTIRTILRAIPDRNISNIRIKYVNPICLAQFGTEKDYSCAALKAHLGEGQCPQVNDPHPDHALRDVTSYDEEDEKYVIARGTLTDELVESFKTIKEIRRSLFPRSCSLSSTIDGRPKMSPRHRTISKRDSEREPVPKMSPRHRTISVRDSERESVPKMSPRHRTISFRDSEREAVPKPIVKQNDLYNSSSFSLHFPSPKTDFLKKTHWDVESFPSTLHNLETDFPKPKRPTEESNTKSHSDNLVFTKLKGFFNTCFCRCFEGRASSKTSNKNNYTVPNKNIKFVEENKIHSSRFRSNVKIVRTTESDFLYNKPKTKIKRIKP